MHVKITFTSKDTVKITGVSYRQLDYWDRIGFITPSILCASGKGSSRLYSFNDLINIKVAKELREAGASINKIMKSIKYIKYNKQMSKNLLSEYIFITDGQSIFVLTDDPKIMVDTLRNGQLCWNINMNRVKQEVIQLISQNHIDKFEKVGLSSMC